MWSQMRGNTGLLLFGSSIIAVIVYSRRKSKPVSTKKHNNSNSSSKKVDVTGCCTISAPGKVLIAGGYLVLERPNVGVTISSTSRFYSTVAMLPLSSIHKSSSLLTVQVESPQFYTSYAYQYDTVKSQLIATSATKNEFVEKCLYMVLSFVKESLGTDEFTAIVAAIASKNGQLGVKLRADNDFYSQIKELRSRGMPLLTSSLQKLPRFYACPKDTSGQVIVNKTGMGSSAALTTSLVGALLQWFGVIRLGLRKGDDDRRIVHNLAQLAHAVAQGKIGSGFDVAAAVYGTQLYRRFAADGDGLASCLEAGVSSSVIHATVKDATLWTQTVSAFSLPQSLDIIMGDVCGGSSSASMAREVLKWRKEHPVDAKKTWTSLADTNTKIYETLNALSTMFQTNPGEYHSAIAMAAEQTADQWQILSTTPNVHSKVISQLVELRKLFKVARDLMRHMGQGSGVEIVPDEQQKLIEKTEALAGVLCAGLPGAGGHDAIFAITLSSAARNNIETLWSNMSVVSSNGTVSVCPLILRAEGGMKSGVRAEFEMQWE